MSQAYNRLWSFSSTGSNILLVPKSFQFPCPAILPPFRWIEYSKGFYCQGGSTCISSQSISKIITTNGTWDRLLEKLASPIFLLFLYLFRIHLFSLNLIQLYTYIIVLAPSDIAKYNYVHLEGFSAVSHSPFHFRRLVCPFLMDIWSFLPCAFYFRSLQMFNFC